MLRLFTLISIVTFLTFGSVKSVEAQSFCPAGGSGDGRASGVNPKGNNISTLDPVGGIYYLPSDGSGLPFAYSSVLAANESPAYRIVLSLYDIDTGRIAYTYSNGSDPAMLEFTFTQPGSYYFVKNLIYAAGTVCTAYFVPDSVRPACGTFHALSGTETSTLLDYVTCSGCSSGPYPYCRDSLNNISIGSAEQFVEIRPALPSSTPTVTPTATLTPTHTPTSSPTTTPTSSPSPTPTPTGAPTATPTATPTHTPTPTPTPTPTLGPPPITASAWWQVYSGHISAVNGISSLLPMSMYVAENSLTSSETDSAGAVMSTGGSMVFGSGLSTENSNFHNSRISTHQNSVCEQFSFDQIKQLVNLNQVTPITDNAIYTTLEELVEDTTEVVQSGGAKVLYIKDGNLLLAPSSTWLYTDSDNPLLIFVENGSIIVDGVTTLDKALLQIGSSSFVSFFTTGDITILGSVGNSPGDPYTPSTANLAGVFFAEGNLEIGSSGNNLTEKQFVGYGSFIGCSGVNLRRSFESLLNATTPSEVFIYNPYLIQNAPLILMETLINWNDL